MPYAYPKSSNHPDAVAHVKQFRSIWVVNHGTQGLSPAEREQSMILEFQLSLEGQAARWYAQQEINTFVTFQDLVDKFLEMFKVKIDPTEVLKEYYSLLQQAGESVADFLLRFPSRTSYAGYGPSRGNSETSVSEGFTRTAPICLCIDGCFHGAVDGNHQPRTQFGSPATRIGIILIPCCSTLPEG
jgi:hypothetical protein